MTKTKPTVPFEKVRKRDGRIVDFDVNRIESAIFKAAQSVGGKDRETASNLAWRSVAELEKRLSDKEAGYIPSVEEVQDSVERVLIHAGYAENLLLRAADVTLKEQRRLILAVRETPLNPIHLRNMQELSMIPGVRIIPPMMEFYTKPETIDEMVYHIAAKLVSPFGVETPEYRRWKD